MKNVIRTVVLAVAAVVVTVVAGSAQAGGYGHGGQHHYHYAPVYRPVIVQKVFVPVTPIYTAPIYNSYCH